MNAGVRTSRRPAGRVRGPAAPGMDTGLRARVSLLLALVVAAAVLGVGAAQAEGTLIGLWSRKAGRSITVSPSPAPGRVYTLATDGRVQCLRLADGRRLWHFRLKEAADVAPAWSPWGEGGRLFLASGENGNFLNALNASRGRRDWSKNLGATITALAADDSIVVTLVGKGALSGWRARDGAPLWSRDLTGWDPPPFLLEHGILYAAMRRDSLLALDVDTGAVRWRAAPGGTFAASPVVVGTMLALADVDGVVSWIDRETGALRGGTTRSGWQLSAGGAIDSTLVTVSTGGRVERGGSRPSAEDWSTDLAGAVVAPPLIRRDRVLVGSTRGGLSALEARSGKVLWSFQSAGGFRVSPMAVGDTLLLADTRGIVHVYLDSPGRN